MMHHAALLKFETIVLNGGTRTHFQFLGDDSMHTVVFHFYAQLKPELYHNKYNKLPVA